VPVEMLQSVLKLLLKQIILAVHHDLDFLVAKKLATFSLKTQHAWKNAYS